MFKLVNFLQFFKALADALASGVPVNSFTKGPQTYLDWSNESNLGVKPSPQVCQGGKVRLAGGEVGRSRGGIISGFRVDASSSVLSEYTLVQRESMTVHYHVAFLFRFVGTKLNSMGVIMDWVSKSCNLIMDWV